MCNPAGKPASEEKCVAFEAQGMDHFSLVSGEVFRFGSPDPELEAAGV